MSTRTYEEIKPDVGKAIDRNDTDALQLYAVELESVGSPIALALAAYALGWTTYRQGSYASSLEHYQRAQAGYQELADQSGVAATICNIGTVHFSTGNYPQALEHFHRALAAYELIEKRIGIATVYNGIGMVHLSTASYPQALEYYHRALAVYEELGNQPNIASVTSNVGSVHSSTGNYAKALEYYHRALEAHEVLGDQNLIAADTGNIGIVHLKTGNHAEALEHFQRALHLFEAVGDRNGMATVTSNIVSALIATSSYAEAMALLDSMDTMQIDDPNAVVSREISRAAIQTHYQLIDDAVHTLRATLTFARDHSLAARQAEIHKQLRDLCQMHNDFAGYIEHNNEFTRITEEINGKESTQKIAMQEAEHKMAKERSEHERHLAVLHSTLPKHIADRVARGETVNDHHDNAAVLFLDIVDFTSISEKLSSNDVVQFLERVFTALDNICTKHDIVKIKTIGDSYMAVAFGAANSEQRIANAALEMLYTVSHILPDLPSGLLSDLLRDLPSGLLVRIGLHSGAITAGVLGTTRMQYDVWGDTVNVASRMESTSEPGRIHVSSSFALALKGEMAKARNGDDRSPFPVPCSLFPRGEIEIKGKGLMKTYWLE